MDRMIVVGGGLLAVSLLLVSPSVARWLDESRPDTGRKFAKPDDPPPGTPIEIPDWDVDGKSTRSEGRTLLAFMGQCSSCALNAVPPERIRTSGYGRVVLVFHASAAQMPKGVRHLGEPFRTVADPNGDLERRVGALWYPRFVVLDGDRRWVRGQPAPGEVAPYVLAGAKS